MGCTTVLGHVTPTHLDDAVHRGLVLQVLRRSLGTVTLQLLRKSSCGVYSLRFCFRHF